LRFDASKDENMPLPFESDHYKYLGVLS
jgi:hypothetical protein